MTVERAPAPFSRRLALVAAAAVLPSALFSTYGLVAALLGLVVFGGALFVPSRRLLDVGAAALGLGALFGALEGPTALLPLLGGAATVVAWDVGENAIGIGEQLGRETRTRRTEIAHAAASALVGVVAALAGYVVYRIAGGGRPVAALVFLLVAGVLLMIALRQ